MTKREHQRRLEQAFQAQERKQNKPNVAVLCLFAMLLVAIAWVFRWNSRDWKDAPLRTVTTVVTRSSVASARGSGYFYTSAVVEGVAVSLKLARPIPEGAPVVVTYRRGASGSIYVEYMTSPKPPKR